MAGLYCLKLDRGEPAEPALAAPTVVGSFDPGHDGQAQFLSGGPALPVQDVLLQQREEGLHGCIVATGPDPAHGSGQSVALERPDEHH